MEVRNDKGQIVLDNYNKLDNAFTRGRKQKIWLEKDEIKYLFKYGASNYEIWAELLTTELANQCGFEVAEYELATYKGKIGVVTKDFKKNGELIISGDRFIKSIQEILEENNIYHDIKENSIENIMFAIGTYSLNQTVPDLFQQILNIWVFDGLVLESDRNNTNWSILKQNNSIRFAPIYDCSTMAMLNNDISHFISSARFESDFLKITDQVQCALKLYNSSDGNFLKDFDLFCQKYPEQSKILIGAIEKIDIQTAIDNIERKINYNGANNHLDWQIQYWITKVIELRKRDMISIFKKYNKNKTII